MSETRNPEFNKTRKRSVHLLHIMTGVDEQRGMLSFCCESQPLATVRTFGTPVRCPFCQQLRPVGGKKKADGVVER